MRQRLDLLVVQRGLLSSRQAAQSAIIDGAVLVDGQKVTKPGQNINVEAKLALIPSFALKRYVSRGGLKLEKALRDFSIAVENRICLDVGASTGGFTDCLLQKDALRVYAIDVGYGQFDWKLRNDPRVVLRERENIRFLTARQLYGEVPSPAASLAVIDVSFISLKLILPACLHLLSADKAEMICLIKPQFEVGKGLVGKGGVVKSVDLQVTAIDHVLEMGEKLNLAALGLAYSPIVGPAGNIEFLVHFALKQSAAKIFARKIVEQAHADLLAAKE